MILRKRLLREEYQHLILVSKNELLLLDENRLE